MQYMRWPMNNIGEEPTLVADRLESDRAEGGGLMTRTAIFYTDGADGDLRVGLLNVPRPLSGLHQHFDVQIMHRYIANRRERSYYDGLAVFQGVVSVTGSSMGATWTGGKEGASGVETLWATEEETATVPASDILFSCDAWEHNDNADIVWWMVAGTDNARAEGKFKATLEPSADDGD